MNRFSTGLCAMILALGAGVSAQTTDWKGFYVGGNAGGVKGSADTFTSTVFSPTGYFAMSSVPAIAAVGKQKLSPRGFTGGGQVGYNFQTGHFVLGLETDFGAMHVNDDFVGSTTYPCCAPTNFTVKQSISTDWLWTARPRVGVAAGPVLVYGTAGVALTNLSYQALFIDTFATAHENAGVDEIRTGWIAGGGVEFKIGGGSHWSMKGEYLLADFGQVKTTSTNLTAFTPAVAFPTNVFTHQADLQQHIFRTGFNYRF
jgi:outer membrane immunogenic protein